MSSFYTIACYAALTACSQSDIIAAYARMVAALIRKKRYDLCTAEILSADFKQQYGFPVPYHPMQTIMDECIKLGFLTYNSSIHQCIPNYNCIDCEDFMDIVEEKNLEFGHIISEFNDYLIDTYGIHSSSDDLNDKILAFIERYGIKASNDKGILRKVKDDFLFADFLVSCIESGKEEVLNYLDEYTIGLSLSEVFTYCEKPETYTSRGTCVYLDTSLLFRLLGIGSSDHSNSYTSFLRNMRQLGMRLKVYDHTINEMIGIIEGAKYWIGNPNFDASLASEAAYFFVRNGWTIDEVDRFSCDLRTRLQEDYQIAIDSMPYPKAEDIKTPPEAKIKEMIVAEYRGSSPNSIIEERDYSIDQDAKSIFFTQHKNNTVIPYHINDIKNIFITSNRSLAKVGYQLCYSLAGHKDYFIPTVMTEVKWGTLLWFNSPSNISEINRPALASAAYAAFRPSAELTHKLNTTLAELERQGSISPEQCYLLKVNPIAQRLLAKKTINNPDRFIEETPLEILKELRQEAFSAGSSSRQQEISDLEKEKEKIEIGLAIEKQKNVIQKCEQTYSEISKEARNLSDRLEEVTQYLDELAPVESEIEVCVKNWGNVAKIGFSILAALLAIGAIYVGVKWSWIIGVVSFLFPLLLEIITLWGNEKITLLSLIPKIENAVRKKQYKLRRYSTEHVSSLKKRRENTIRQLREVNARKAKAEENLKNEQAKLEAFL